MGSPGAHHMNKIIVLDTTLRDGELTHGVSFAPADKLAIASLLAASGVDVIEVAVAGESGGWVESVRAIVREVRSCTVCVLAPMKEAAIERAAAALEGAASARIHVFQAGAVDDDCISRTESLLRRARQLVDDVEFTPANGACAPLEDVTGLSAAALRGGATTISLADTLGRALPEGVAARIREISTRVPALAGARLSFHGHDDLGLATANTLAAVRAGAKQVEVAVNGLGARAGNAALEEFVAAVGEHGEALDARTDVDLEALAALSRLVAEKSALAVPPNKAIVGRHVHWKPTNPRGR
jgi:2-isopropylmalate synthase